MDERAKLENRNSATLPAKSLRYDRDIADCYGSTFAYEIMEWMIPSFPRPVGPIAPILDSCPYVPLLATLIATNKVIISVIPEAALLGLFESDLRKKAVRAGELESAFL